MNNEEQELRARLADAQSALDALRNHEVDAVVGSQDVHLLRLNELEDQYPSLLKNLPDAVFRLDQELRHLYVSPVVKLLTGKDPGAYFQKTGLEAGYPEEVWIPFERACRRLLRDDEPQQLEFQYETPHGVRCLHVRLFPEKAEAEGEVRFILGIIGDITEQRKAQNALQSSEERLAAALEGADLGTWEYCLRTGVCTHWDGRMAALYDISPPLSDGIDPLSLRAHPEDRDALLAALGQTRIDGRLEHTYRIVRANSEIRWIRLAGRRKIEDNGEIRLIGIADDVTAQKIAEHKLACAKEAAERADRTKSDFLANLSHEIRTPMTVILGYAEVLRGKLEGDFALQCVNSIRDSGNLLLTIINDVLDLSKIEAGKLALKWRQVPTRTLIEEAVSLMRGAADRKNLLLQCTFGEHVPAQIETDPDRLKQILINLLSNAIKFTQKGKVEVHTSYAPRTATLRIAVADTGIGISPQFREKLFQPFEQAPNSSEDFRSGTGLGLAICRRLSGMLGGSVNLESTSENGSVFSLLLRLPRATDSGQAPAAVPRDEARPSSLVDCNVLIVDDQPDVRNILDHFLQQLGCSTMLTSSGTEALEMIGHVGDSLGLVLLDMRLPDMDGYEVARRLRQTGFSKPIIAITAHAMEAHRKACIDAGCTDFLSKPIDHDALVEVLLRHLAT